MKTVKQANVEHIPHRHNFRHSLLHMHGNRKGGSHRRLAPREKKHAERPKLEHSAVIGCCLRLRVNSSSPQPVSTRCLPFSHRISKPRKGFRCGPVGFDTELAPSPSKLPVVWCGFGRETGLLIDLRLRDPGSVTGLFHIVCGLCFLATPPLTVLASRKPQ